MSLFPDLDRRLDAISTQLTDLAMQQARDRHDFFAAFNQMRKLQEKSMATLDQVLSDVTDESTVIDGVMTLVSGLRQQVADLLAKTGMSADDQAKVDAIFAAAEANKAKLGNALVSNTPATPSP